MNHSTPALTPVKVLAMPRHWVTHNPPLTSTYDATNLAAYGEAEWRLACRTTLSAGLRVETRSADYNDSYGASFSPVNTMWGGHLSLVGHQEHITGCLIQRQVGVWHETGQQ